MRAAVPGIARRPRPGVIDQVHDRSPARCERGGGGCHDRPGVVTALSAAHDQPARARPGVRPGFHPERRTLRVAPQRPLQLPWIRIKKQRASPECPAIKRLQTSGFGLRLWAATHVGVLMTCRAGRIDCATIWRARGRAAARSRAVSPRQTVRRQPEPWNACRAAPIEPVCLDRHARNGH